MSETKQPTWKNVGHVGDVDPIAHGGGFVYVDEGGAYGPELQWFEPGSDEEWQRKAGLTKLQTYRILLEQSGQSVGPKEWWHEKLGEVATSTGQPLAELEAATTSEDPMELARLYQDLIGYFGAYEFDQYPREMTEDDAYARHSAEMGLSLGRSPQPAA